MQTKLHIEGMHCNSCAIDIKETLEENAGILRADVDEKGKTAIVEFDENTIQPNAFIKIIQDLGYQTEVAAN
ncbi:MAG: heavy-metal-associated domain-containing protein [Pyrinomonadaceae bacterium]|nr:heavy-metal-associated domain-containing protein [Pyrinomonadaceae bacterium]